MAHGPSPPAFDTGAGAAWALMHLIYAATSTNARR
jgi:hypothetical protein